jgi:putative tryptophan/tyrosine transport system substrate-binding protein
VLINAADQIYVQRYAKSLQQDGQNLGMGIQTVEVNGTSDIERAFSTIQTDSSTGVAAAADVMFYNERKPIIDLALTNRLPSSSTTKNSSKREVFYLTAPTSRKFSAALPFMWIKSSRAPSPSILPVEQPTLFRMFANLQTAKSLGLTIQPTALILADQVIE